MIRKEIHFEDFDGKPVVETHYFHFSLDDLIDLETSIPGGMAAKYQTLLEGKNALEMYKAFREIVVLSYGLRDPANGMSFDNSREVQERFRKSLAYQALIQELVSSEEAAAEFINGLMPQQLMARVQAQSSSGTIMPNVARRAAGLAPPPADSREDALTGLKEPRDRSGAFLPWAFRDPTDQELTQMTKAQMLDCMRRRSSNWEPRTG